eukprot:1161926-Pelagomonas_calceolata.AAC.4
MLTSMLSLTVCYYLVLAWLWLWPDHGSWIWVSQQLTAVHTSPECWPWFPPSFAHTRTEIFRLLSNY